MFYIIYFSLKLKGYHHQYLISFRITGKSATHFYDVNLDEQFLSSD